MWNKSKLHSNNDSKAIGSEDGRVTSPRASDRLLIVSYRSQVYSRPFWASLTCVSRIGSPTCYDIVLRSRSPCSSLNTSIWSIRLKRMVFVLFCDAWFAPDWRIARVRLACAWWPPQYCENDENVKQKWNFNERANTFAKTDVTVIQTSNPMQQIIQCSFGSILETVGSWIKEIVSKWMTMK